jgi:hypothetical protein
MELSARQIPWSCRGPIYRRMPEWLTKLIAVRKPSCLISCSIFCQFWWEGTAAMNLAGKVRCNIVAIAKGYSCVSQPFFD